MREPIDHLAIWDDLPDPRGPAGRRCTIEVSVSAWRHMREKHLGSPQEPWAEWLTPELLAALLSPADDPEGSPDRDRAVTAALARLGSAIRATLERPLVLLYEARGPSGRQGGETWLLVLPNGAQAVVRSRSNSRLVLVTSYYPRCACRADRPAQRWRRLVSRLIATYAVMAPEGGLGAPPEDRVFPIRDEGASGRARARVRFLSPEMWGFDTRLRGAPWRGHLPPWSDEAPVSRSRCRLRPRRRFEEDADV